MNVSPFWDRILVRPKPFDDKTTGGIIITCPEIPDIIEGEIVKTGKGLVKDNGTVIPLELKPGDKIYFSKYVGVKVSVDGVDHLFMKEEDVLAVKE